MKQRKKRYVNNRDFYNAIIEYYKQDKNRERIPKYLLECITEMVKRVGHKPNFRYYSYLDDMKQEAIISCHKALIDKKFDPSRTENPFAYFTTCIWNKYINFIEKENIQTNTKEKMIIEKRNEFYSDGSSPSADFADEYYSKLWSYRGSNGDKNINSTKESSSVRIYSLKKHS